MPNANYKLHCTCPVIWSEHPAKLRQMLKQQKNSFAHVYYPAFLTYMYMYLNCLIQYLQYTVLKPVIIQNCVQTLRSVPSPVYTGNS